jgi:hypothetical protein
MARRDSAQPVQRGNRHEGQQAPGITDYITATEQLKVLEATARDKKCAVLPD